MNARERCPGSGLNQNDNDTIEARMGGELKCPYCGKWMRMLHSNGNFPRHAAQQDKQVCPGGGMDRDDATEFRAGGETRCPRCGRWLRARQYGGWPSWKVVLPRHVAPCRTTEG